MGRAVADRRVRGGGDHRCSAVVVGRLDVGQKDADGARRADDVAVALRVKRRRLLVRWDAIETWPRCSVMTWIPLMKR